MCAAANAHLAACVPGSGPIEPVIPSECVDVTHCASECFMNASCDDLRSFSKGDLSTTSDLFACEQTCNGR